MERGAVKMGVIDFLTIILLAVAIITLVFMGWETSLTRKQMRGEVYGTARVKDFHFPPAGHAST